MSKKKPVLYISLRLKYRQMEKWWQRWPMCIKHSGFMKFFAGSFIRKKKFVFLFIFLLKPTDYFN